MNYHLGNIVSICLFLDCFSFLLLVITKSFLNFLNVYDDYDKYYNAIDGLSLCTGNIKVHLFPMPEKRVTSPHLIQPP